MLRACIGTCIDKFHVQMVHLRPTPFRLPSAGLVIPRIAIAWSRCCAPCERPHTQLIATLVIVAYQAGFKVYHGPCCTFS